MNAVEPDRLRVFFKESWFFIDAVERQTLQPETILTIELERQFKAHEFSKLKELEEQVTLALNSSGAVAWLTNICLTSALKYLWKMINLF